MKIKIQLLIIIVLMVSFLIGCTAIPKHLLPTEDDDAKTLLKKGRDIFDLDAYEKALEIYFKIIEKYPDERETVAWAYYEIGFTYYRMEKWQESLSNLYIAIKQYEKDNKAAYILSYKLYRRIKYALDTDNKEILKHNSSYAIPDDYDPFASEENTNDDSDSGNDDGDAGSDDDNSLDW